VEVKAALSVAVRLGLPYNRADVLSESMSTVIHLLPHPIVARVTRVTHLVRPIEQASATVSLAQLMPGITIAPAEQVPPGPHLAEGRYVTFWTKVHAGPVTPGEAGSALRAFHDSAPKAHEGLRSFDPRPEAIRVADIIAGEEGAVLRRAAQSVHCPEIRSQPIHGDAHWGNVVTGGIWMDLDDACWGPPEYDLACLRHRRFLFGEFELETADALEAYGSFDEDTVSLMDPLVVLWTAAWGSMAPLCGEPIASRTYDRLAWLKEHYG